MLPKPVFWAFLLLICAYAFWRGHREEKIAASVALLATIATRFLISPLSVRYTQVEFGLLAIDVVVLAAFVGIALYSDRFWPLWAAGFQLTVSMSHLIKSIEIDLLPRAYGVAAVFWSYPILLVILIGTWRTHRRATAPAMRSSSAY